MRLCEFKRPDGGYCDGVSITGTAYCRHHQIDQRRAQRIRTAAAAVELRKRRVVSRRLEELGNNIHLSRAQVKKELEGLISAGYITRPSARLYLGCITLSHDAQRMILRDNKRLSHAQDSHQ